MRVVRENGHRVRTLAAREPFAKGVAELASDRRTDDGELAPDGRYRVTVRLGGGDTLVFPQRVILDTVAPKAELKRVSANSVTPGEPVVVTYGLSEAGSAILYVDGTEAGLGAAAPAREDRVGRSVAGCRRRGELRLTVVARDVAGNAGDDRAADVVSGASRSARCPCACNWPRRSRRRRPGEDGFGSARPMLSRTRMWSAKAASRLSRAREADVVPTGYPVVGSPTKVAHTARKDKGRCAPR